MFCVFAVVPTISVAAQSTSSSQIRDHRTESTSDKNKVRDHRQSETPVILKANQRLLLTNGVYVEHLANGTVNAIEMNGRVVRSFPQGKIFKDKSGRITILSRQQRMQAGVFKAIETVAVRDVKRIERDLDESDEIESDKATIRAIRTQP